MTAPLLSPLRVGVGDVLAVATGHSLADDLIKIGAVIEGESGLNNHVVVVHHITDGVWWGLEGKPGGVGWADLRRYLNDPHTTSNVDQPKTDAQRLQLAQLAPTLLGTQYDWRAIGDDTLAALHLTDLFAHDWNAQGAPGHVVCSSFAAWLYWHVGLAHPAVHSERLTTPADWTEWNLTRGWTAPR